MADPRATVLIINYNGLADLPELFSTLREQTWRDFEIVFVDNASSDGSLEYMQRKQPDINVCAHGKNLGYARAANIGVKEAPTEYVVILNTDIKLDPRCMEELLEVADSDPSIACAACKMRLYHQPRVLNGVGGGMNYIGYTWDRGMFEVDEGQYDEVEDVIFACGGAALVRRSHFLKAGGYDLGFYMYHEDVDLCWRFWLLGHRVVTAPKSLVYHHFSHSTRDNRGMDWRELIGERNSIRSMAKNYEFRNLIDSLSDLMRVPQNPERKRLQRKNLRWNIWKLPDTLLRRIRIQMRRKRSDAEIQHLIDPSPEVPIDIYGFIPSEHADEGDGA